MAPRTLIESLLLESVQRDLFSEAHFNTFKQKVLKLLAGRARRPAAEQERARRELQHAERERSNIMAAIRQGIVTPTTKAALHQAEAECERLQAELRVQTSTSDQTSLLAPNLKARFEQLVGNLASLKQKHIEQARAILKTLLGPEILLHPSADGAERFLTAELSGN